ncbi:MAG: hypothetical protein BroJett042_20780 [Bacteroidota bacterium]|nr:MAG: hypothetical protein BroJett042_20780 [Bacteroidota bacterium]
MFSCSNDQELKPETKILREDWHLLVNIGFIAQNEPAQSMVRGFVEKNNLGEGYSIPYSKETIHFLDGGFSQAFPSNSDLEDYLVINVSKSGKLSYFFMQGKDELFSFRSKDEVLFEFDSNKRKLVQPKRHYPGDCNQLGGPRPGESYGDCFLRNWDNFCCDFSGCASQMISGPSVAIAIGISCLGEPEEEEPQLPPL